METRCRDCGWVDNTQYGVDKCPDCKSDDWEDFVSKPKASRFIDETFIRSKCPFCKGCKAQCQEEEEVFYVMCTRNSCRVTGPMRATSKKAIRSWNSWGRKWDIK